MSQNQWNYSERQALPPTGKAVRPVYPDIDTLFAGAKASNWEAGRIGEYGRILWRRKLSFLTIVVACTGVAFVIAKARTPVYRAHALIEIQSMNDDFLNTRSVTPTSSSPYQSPEYNIRTQTMVLESRPVLERALAAPGLAKRTLDAPPAGIAIPGLGLTHSGAPHSNPVEAAVGILSKGLQAHNEPNTRVIELTFDGTDPVLASDTVNSITDAFGKLSLDRRAQSSRETSQWLAGQMDDVRTRLGVAEANLQQYAQAAHLTFLSEKDDASVQRLRDLQTELSKAQADRASKQSVLEAAGTANADSQPAILDNQTLNDYSVQLTTLRRTLADLSQQFTPEYSKIKSIQAQIDTLESARQKRLQNIVSRVTNEYNAAAGREKLITRAYEAQAGVVGQQAGKIEHYSLLRHEVDATRQLYESMMQRVREAGLASAMQASDIRVVEAAVPPEAPFAPNVPMNTAAGLLAGICFGAAFVIQKARASRTVVEPGQLTIELNMPELGVIPASGSESNMRRFLSKSTLGLLSNARPELVTWQQWPSKIGESFRLALTSILMTEKEAAAQVIAFTSANPGEGKSTVVSNLGIALARVGRRVLVIDGDTRRPRQHDIFEKENKEGLTESLANGGIPAVQKTEVPNLFLLPSGQNADENLLFAARLGKLLTKFRTEYDMVLIDTPPMLNMSDARLLGHQADAVILVVAQNTDLDAVMAAQQRLADDGTRMLGTILNNWDPRGSIHAERDSLYYRYYARS